MKHTSPRKLSLRTVTIAPLGPPALQQVAGGTSACAFTTQISAAVPTQGCAAQWTTIFKPTSY